MENLQVGTRVYCALYGGKNGVIYAIHGKQTPETIRSLGGGCIVVGGSADVDVVWDNGTESRRVSEAIVRGIQWRILPGFATDEEIESLRGAAILEANRAADEAATKAAKLAADKEALRNAAEFSHLKQTGTDGWGSAKLAAANIRAELKKAYPGVKFSVRSDTFSGGDSVDVKWTDGPILSDVRKIADKYSAGSFNGMEDIYEYSSSAWTAVFGDAKYVHCTRSHSPEALKEAVREVCLDYGWELLKVETSSYDGTAHLPCDSEDRYRKVYDWIEKRGIYSPEVDQ